MWAADSSPLSPTEAGQRIATLRTEIAHHDELYFKQAAPVITDAAYDLLKRELGALEQAFPTEAAHAASAPSPMGDDRSGVLPTGRHRRRMLSLQKSFTESDLRTFAARVARKLGRSDVDFVVEPKFDGIAVSATYEHGRLVRVLTRGNGEVGDDITANALTIPALAQALRAAVPDGATNPQPGIVELRGEVFCPHPEFARLNRERESAGEVPFSHPRNLVAGTLKLLDPGEVAQRHLEVVFYGMGACEPAAQRPATQLALLRQLCVWGLPTVEAPRVVHGTAEMWAAVQAVGRERAGYRFPTDGAVVKVDDVALQERLGETEQAPLWAMAFKFAPERVETQLRAITLQVGRTGVLTPVAELAPVRLGGANVARATLHNRDEIRRADLRIGDFVYVEKAGEVIPAIAGVNLARRPADLGPYAFPTTCPECAAGLVEAPGDAAVRCPNESCPGQIRRRVEYFASAGCVHIPGLGAVLIAKLVAARRVQNVADLYRLGRADLVAAGAGEGPAGRILAAIEKSRRAELWRVVRGLGIPHVGESAARTLGRRFSGLEALVAVQRGDLFPDGHSPVAGLNAVAASAVLEYFTQPNHRALVEDLRSLGVEATTRP